MSNTTTDLDGVPFGPAVPPDDKKPLAKTEACAGCGGLHRGLTEELNCLRASCNALRDELRASR